MRRKAAWRAAPLMLCLALPACSPTDTDAGPGSDVVDATPPPGDVVLQAGMAYGAFRERVLAAGWTPRVDPA